MEEKENNRKHHKYVTVNKYQRKKQKRFFNILKILKLRRLAIKWLNESIRYFSESWHYTNYGDLSSGLPSNSHVIYDDCNHTKGRIIQKHKDGSKSIKYFKKTVGGYQLYIPRLQDMQKYYVY